MKNETGPTAGLAGSPVQPDILFTPDGARAQVWRVPPEQQRLQEILSWIFEQHWDRIVFGPLIEGAAYEFRCPCAPRKISIFFPNPFLTDEDGIASRPNWERLVVWESVAGRFLGIEPQQFDRSGRGFAHG